MMHSLNLKFARTPRQNTSVMSQVEALLLANPGGISTNELMAALPELGRRQVSRALSNLANVGRAHTVQTSASASSPHTHYPGPARATSDTGTRAERISHMQRSPYVPERWSNEVARPGGEAHKQYGSLQPDGTVKPYRAPRYDCVGTGRPL